VFSIKYHIIYTKAAEDLEEESEDAELTRNRTQEPSSQEVNFMRIPNVLYLISIFSFNTFSAAVLGGLIPFWVAAKFSQGGLDFNYKDIGDLSLYLTVPQITLQIILYPYIQKKRGDYWLLRCGHLLYIPIFGFLPFAHSFSTTFLQKGWIILWVFIRNMASFMNFAALQKFTNDVIKPENRGKLNGVQVTFSSLGQVAGPFIGQWLLSWSLTNGMSFPLDYYLVFMIMVVLTICNLIFFIDKLSFADKAKTKLVAG
jgi:MFS family permease